MANVQQRGSRSNCIEKGNTPVSQSSANALNYVQIAEMGPRISDELWLESLDEGYYHDVPQYIDEYRDVHKVVACGVQTDHDQETETTWDCQNSSLSPSAFRQNLQKCVLDADTFTATRSLLDNI